MISFFQNRQFFRSGDPGVQNFWQKFLEKLSIFLKFLQIFTNFVKKGPFWPPFLHIFYTSYFPRYNWKKTQKKGSKFDPCTHLTKNVEKNVIYMCLTWKQGVYRGVLKIFKNFWFFFDFFFIFLQIFFHFFSFLFKRCQTLTFFENWKFLKFFFRHFFRHIFDPPRDPLFHTKHTADWPPYGGV